MQKNRSMSWLKFLRHYGPVPQNDNMYDETIQRFACRHGISPIEFIHPFQDRIIECFKQVETAKFSVILTGTAGDGKTHLCRQVWCMLNGNDDSWSSNSPYLSIEKPPAEHFSLQLDPKGKITSQREKIHFIRDLSGWAPQQGSDWEPEKEKLLQDFCHSIFASDTNEIFLIAANDGQLIECFRRLKENEDVVKARQLFEDLLVEDKQEESGVNLKFFNLSRTNSAELFDRAIKGFLNHTGWAELKQNKPIENEAFSAKCPIRHNYELLENPLIQSRLRSLFELCDHNGIHVPIRQILLLLANAVLGHPDVKDYLMVAADVPRIITQGTISKASLYNNIFGGNLPENRRQSVTIFDYFERFQIGYETSNRIDNILIFGEGDESLGAYFDNFVAEDKFYGSDDLFYAAKRAYIEGADEYEDNNQEFLQMLISQRRGLFFKIPIESESELNLWELTVFKFAGEYLNSVVGVMKNGVMTKRPILSRLVKGLNRVFTGMLMNSERELYLAMSANYSQAKISPILIERISVEPSKGEKITLCYDSSKGRIFLAVYFTPELHEDLELTLIRYEFLSRIALDGALPASFSKECYEDLLAFKSRLIAVFMQRQATESIPSTNTICLNLLGLSEQGIPETKFLEITL